MTYRLSIARVDDGFVIDDGGRIARALKMGETPWQLVAETDALVADRVRELEVLINAAETLAALGLMAMSPPALKDAGLGRAADRSVRVLGPTRSAWRLKAAGITTIGQLAGYSEEELGALAGVGPALVRYCKTNMERLGYRLKKAIGPLNGG